jgi:hypothetical protein
MADRLLCQSPRCRIPGRHTEACPGESCKGCQPGHAADGARLCLVCTKRIGDNAVKLAMLYGELELVLKAIGNGERSSSKPGSGTPPRDAVVEMRATIRHLLASWCRLVSEERGITLPADDVTAMGAYLARHADWLAATDYAGECADELAEHVGRAWGLAYPNGTRVAKLPEPCPTCGGTLLAIRRATDGVLPSEVACDGDEPHVWPASQWRWLDRLISAKKKAMV